jgi:hypothetical protein
MPKLYHHERIIDREFENLYTRRIEFGTGEDGPQGPPGRDGPDGPDGTDGLNGEATRYSKLITNISRWWQDTLFRDQCAVPGEWRDIFMGPPYWWDGGQTFDFWQQLYLDRFAIVPASNYGYRDVPVGWRYDSHYAIGELPGNIIVTGIWLHLIEYFEVFDNRNTPFAPIGDYSEEFFIYLRDKGTPDSPIAGQPIAKAFNPVAWSGELLRVATNNEADDLLWSAHRYPRGKALNLRPLYGNTIADVDQQVLVKDRQHRQNAGPTSVYKDQQWIDKWEDATGFPGTTTGLDETIFGRRESYIGPNGAWIYLDVFNELFRNHHGWLNFNHLDPTRWPLAGGNILLTIIYEEL